MAPTNATNVMVLAILLAIVRRTKTDVSDVAKLVISLAIAVDRIRLSSATTAKVWDTLLGIAPMPPPIIPDHFQPIVIIATSLAIWLGIALILVGAKLVTFAENKVILAVNALKPKIRNIFHM